MSWSLWVCLSASSPCRKVITMGYKEQVKTAIGLDSIPGFMLLRSDANTHRTELATWDAGKHTVIRILPEVKENSVVPARMSEEDNDFSDWICAENMVFKFGVHEKFSCFTKAKDAPDDVSPIELFCRTVHKAVKNNERSIPRDWELWCKGAKDRSPELSRVGKCGLVQCVVVERKGGPIIDDKTKKRIVAYPCMFVLKPGARYDFENLLNMRNEDGSFVVGDFLGEGRLFKIDQVPYNPATKAMPHYGITVCMNEDGTPKTYPVSDEVMLSWRPWADLLRFLTVEEQMKLLCRAFPPEILDYALGRTGFASYLPESVIGRWHQRSADTGPLRAPQVVPAPAPVAPPPQRAVAESDEQFVRVSELPMESEGSSEDDDVPFDADEVEKPRVQSGLVQPPINRTITPTASPSFDPAKSAVSKNAIRERLNAARLNRPK